MQLKPNLFVAAVALALPAAAAAQMSGQGYGQQSSQSQPSSAQGMSQDSPTTAGTTTGLTRSANEQADAGQVKQATAADIKAGAEVYDPKGGTVGKVESVAADGVVVSTGTVKAKIPASSLGKSDKGLVIAMTKAEFEAAAKKSKS
jgi:preprotein translocase subunit YajC